MFSRELFLLFAFVGWNWSLHTDIELGGGVRLLTFGLHTYSGDERLSINFEQPNNWKLRIKSTEKNDDGSYQCQISSHPPIVLHVTLSIIGGYPYPTVNNHELLTYLSEGYRLEQPENFSKYLYELMLQCWADHSTSVILPGYTHHAVGGIDAGNISRIYTFISYGALISAVRRTLGVELLRKSLRRCYGVLRTLY